jgi:protoporphyrinogen oxidase
VQKTPVLIAGAGLTGLSCALHLGRDYLLVEKEDEPGGIVRTRLHDGFYCDGTGHWLHLRNADMRALVERVLAGELVEYERRAVIHSHGTFTPYPFPANTFGLPRKVVLECLLGLLQARHPEDFGLTPPAGEPRNFREGIERLFGAGICKHFMVPYNEKLLGVKLEEISPEYATRFIPRPSLEDVLRGALGFSREALGYNARFVYPRQGGIGALPKALAAALPIPPRYETSLTAVDLAARTATLSTGAIVQYERLLNTAPLVVFARLLKEVPPPVREALSRLRATTVYYFDLGVRGAATARASDYHWIYFPEPQFIFYRVGSYSAVHAEAAPPGCRSYYVEMAGGIAELLTRPEELKARVLEDLRRAEVLSAEDEVLFMELRTLPHAYVIFDRHYEAARKTVIDFLAQHGVRTAGRWGGWNYGGMEDALLEGRAAAEDFQASPPRLHPEKSTT